MRHHRAYDGRDRGEPGGDPAESIATRVTWIGDVQEVDSRPPLGRLLAGNNGGRLRDLGEIGGEQDLAHRAWLPHGGSAGFGVGHHGAPLREPCDEPVELPATVTVTV